LSAAAAVPAAAPDRTICRRAWMLIGALTAVRLWLCGAFELQGDEAYFWRWSQHLDWCYYSKGPGIAVLIRLGTSLFGASELGVRFLAVLAAAGASVALFELGRALGSPRLGFWAVVVANTTPLWSAGSLLATADMPSILAWTAAALAFWRIRGSSSRLRWVALGLLLGLGTLVRFVVAAEPLAFALYLAGDPASRRRLREPGFALMVAAIAATLVPLAVWQLRHGGITWTHLLERGGFDRPWGLHPLAFAEFAALQFAVVLPYGVAALAAYGRRAKAALGDDAYRYLEALSLPLLGGYALLALNRPGQPNWTGPAYVAVALVVVAAFGSPSGGSPRRRRLAAATLILAILLTAGLHLAVLLAGPPGKRNPLSRLRGSRDLAGQIAAAARRRGAAFVIGDHYQLASLLSFYLPDRADVYTPCGERPANQLDLWGGYGDALLGQDALYVSASSEVPPALGMQFAAIEPLPPLATHWRGDLVNRYFVFACHRLVRSCAGARR
jgi:4-amino-4-deoxy-L-arabinose transferase-like glycosyltransferase